MIRSGSSILNAIQAYREAGAARVIVATTHLVLQTENGWTVLQKILHSGASDLVVTDSLAHAAEQIAKLPDERDQHRIHVASIAGLFARAIEARGRVDQPVS